MAIDSKFQMTVSASTLPISTSGQLPEYVFMPMTAFRFFDLPAELRNMVYTMLYGERREFRLLSRKDHRRRQYRTRNTVSNMTRLR